MSRRLADVHPNEQGTPYREYERLWWAAMREETVRLREPGEPWLSKQPIRTSRDSYGWRSAGRSRWQTTGAGAEKA